MVAIAHGSVSTASPTSLLPKARNGDLAWTSTSNPAIKRPPSRAARRAATASGAVASLPTAVLPTPLTPEVNKSTPPPEPSPLSSSSVPPPLPRRDALHLLSMVNRARAPPTVAPAASAPPMTSVSQPQLSPRTCPRPTSPHPTPSPAPVAARHSRDQGEFVMRPQIPADAWKAELPSFRAATTARGWEGGLPLQSPATAAHPAAAQPPNITPLSAAARKRLALSDRCASTATRGSSPFMMTHGAAAASPIGLISEDIGLAGADDEGALPATLGSGSAPALSYEEFQQQLQLDKHRLALRTADMAEQKHKADMSKARQASADKKSLATERPEDYIRRYLALDLLEAQAASDIAVPSPDSKKIPCLPLGS